MNDIVMFRYLKFCCVHFTKFGMVLERMRGEYL